jgi:hypothetical protein
MTDTFRAARSRQLACLADGQKPSVPRAAPGDGEVEAPTKPRRMRSRRFPFKSAVRPCTNPLRGIGAVDGAYPAPELLTDAASKVGALPQTPPGAEPLDLNT